MRIAIMGSGAVGGYYGARLALAGHDVTFIARGAHLEAIRARGLHVKSPRSVILRPGRLPMTIDLSQGKRIEVEALHGALVRRAARVGVDVPIMATLYAVLKPWATPPA